MCDVQQKKKFHQFFFSEQKHFSAPLRFPSRPGTSKSKNKIKLGHYHTPGLVLYLFIWERMRFIIEAIEIRLVRTKCALK